MGEEAGCWCFVLLQIFRRLQIEEGLEPWKETTEQTAIRQRPAREKTRTIGWSPNWLVAKPGEDTGLCFVDPKFDVDLCMVDDMRAFTSAWTGHSYFGSRSPRCPSHFPATIY